MVIAWPQATSGIESCTKPIPSVPPTIRGPGPQSNNKQIEKAYTKHTLAVSYEKILITMTPILPHFANECLSTIKAKNIKWPEYDVSMLKGDTINIVVQINGKKSCLLYTSPSPRDRQKSRMPSSA